VETFVGCKVAAWIDMKKIDMILQQIQSGMKIDSAAFDDFVASIFSQSQVLIYL
jgi:hypothetical protein